MSFLLALPLADILLSVASFAAATYCFVLSRRLKEFNNLENGMGGAIAVLSVQVDDLAQTLKRAESSAKLTAEQLHSLTDRSESGAQRLEVLLASLHDLPKETHPADDQPPARFLRSEIDKIVLEAAE